MKTTPNMQNPPSPPPKMCKHKFKLLDVEKRVEKQRFSNLYRRTTRFYCTKCTNQKEVVEQIQKGFNEQRPDWTYNLNE